MNEQRSCRVIAEIDEQNRCILELSSRLRDRTFMMEEMPPGVSALSLAKSLVELATIAGKFTNVAEAILRLLPAEGITSEV